MLALIKIGTIHLIREFLTFITHLPRFYKSQRFNHLSQSISLIARENRCHSHWKSHTLRSKETIADALKKAQHNESVLIFGAGPLHEIPIELLAANFKRVVLVDIVHLWETRVKLRSYKNIEFITHDLSELEERLISEIKNKRQLINKIPTSFINESWGLVISANLMSQIPIHFEEFIQKSYSNLFSPTQQANFLKQLSSDHLSYLMSFKTPCLLITDTKTEFYDLRENIFQTDFNYQHLNLPQAIAKWNWDLAPIPEFQKDVGIKMQVEAFLLNSH